MGKGPKKAGTEMGMGPKNPGTEKIWDQNVPGPKCTQDRKILGPKKSGTEMFGPKCPLPNHTRPKSESADIQGLIGATGGGRVV